MLGLVSRFRDGLAKTRAQFDAIFDLALGRGVFDSQAANEIEEALILADVGPELAEILVTELREWVSAAGGGVSSETAREALAMKIARILSLPAPTPAPRTAPDVWLILGINGTGKTTTAARLAAREVAEGRKVLLGAADTFRAAAIDQLRIWGERLDVPVIAQEPGADPAAVAHDAVTAGIARQVDTIIIDTAGRLHTKVNLMKELEKVVRVVTQLKPPGEILLTIDATAGQNGIQQVEAFLRDLPLTGIVVTKLDGSAKAGSILPIVKRFQVPVKWVGMGEGAGDLLPFDPEDFAKALVSH